MQTYTNRYKYRTTQQTSKKSKYITWGVIGAIAILANIIVELPLYQHIIIALS